MRHHVKCVTCGKQCKRHDHTQCGLSSDTVSVSVVLVSFVLRHALQRPQHQSLCHCSPHALHSDTCETTTAAQYRSQRFLADTLITLCETRNLVLCICLLIICCCCCCMIGPAFRSQSECFAKYIV